jgi:hypothetical protein
MAPSRFSMVSVCGQGGFLVDGRCYILRRHPDPLDYVHAQVQCRRLGGYLASFNSKQELYSVRAMLWPRHRTFPLWVGGRIAGSMMSHLWVLVSTVLLRELHRRGRGFNQLRVTCLGSYTIYFFVFEVIRCALALPCFYQYVGVLA